METIILSLFNSLMPYVISFLQEHKSNNDISQFNDWLKENNPKMLTELEKSSKNTIYIKALLNEKLSKIEEIATNQKLMLEYFNSMDEIKFQNQLTHSKLDEITKILSIEPKYKEVIKSLFVSSEINDLSDPDLIKKAKEKIQLFKSYERDYPYIDSELHLEISEKVKNGQVNDAKIILSDSLNANLEKSDLINHQVAIQSFHLGEMSFMLSQYRDAKFYYSKAVSFDDKNLKYLKKLASVESLLGHFYDSQKLYKKIHQVYISRKETDSLKFADALSDLGYAYEQVDNFKSALNCYEKANKITEKHLGCENDIYNTTLNNIAHLYCILGGESGQLNYLYKALNLFEKVHKTNIILKGANHLDTGYSFNNIGGVYMNLKNYKKALHNFEMAYSIYIHNEKNKYFETAIIKMNAGICLNNLDKHSKALKYYQISEEILLKSFDSNHPDICNLRYNKALCLEDLEKLSDAITEMEKVYHGYCQIFGELKIQTRNSKKQLIRLKEKYHNS